MIEHPEAYPAQVFRGRGLSINSLTHHIELELDLGFELLHRVVGTLANLDLPRGNPMDPGTVEDRADAAMCDRVHFLIVDKPLLVIPYRKVVFKPMPAEYSFALFYYAQDRKSNWHSVEDQLVREGHGAWLDPSIPIPTVS